MTHFTPLSALAGGALIGLAATLLLWSHGKIAGISGLYGGIFRPHTPDRGFRVAFIAGLVATGLAARLLTDAPLDAAANLGRVGLAGLLVGVGTQLGNGCTSGHGVCGLSRFSARSLVATLSFMATGAITVYVVRHILGGGG